MKISFSFSFFLLLSFNYFSEDNIDISIPWENPKEIYFENQKIIVPAIVGQGLDFNKPDFYYFKKWKIFIYIKVGIENGQRVRKKLRYNFE